MEPTGVKRKLAVILAADAEGSGTVAGVLGLGLGGTRLGRE